MRTYFSKIKFILSCLFLLTYCCSYGQNIPQDRITDWDISGLKNTDLIVSDSLNVQDYGLVNSASIPNDDALATLLSGLNDELTIIYFPEGSYLFNQSIQVPGNVILKGESSNLTSLIFDLGGQDHLIQIEGDASNTSHELIMDAVSNDHSLMIENTTTFEVGDFILISDSDSALVTSDWAVGSTGQINQISDLNNQILSLESPLRRNFNIEQQANLSKINPIQNVGIENLRIERLDQTTSQSSNIYFNYAANCWIKCVESYHCNYAHVEVRKSTNLLIEGSYFNDAFDFGGGGKAYGVVLSFTTGECLVRNSIFDKLRHSMLLQAGANGNVFAYNYSINPFWTGVNLPADAAGDIVCHGNYPYLNLFEGNIVQNIVIDDSHGSNGPYNTFFRNRLENYGIFMNFNPASDAQNFIGNEIINSGIGLYFLFGEDHYEYGNNHLANIIPLGTEQVEVVSLFGELVSDFYTNTSAWPPIGFPNQPDNYTIEAKDRFADDRLTACAPIITAISEIEKKAFTIHPNPASSSFNIISDNRADIDLLHLYSFDGQRIFSTHQTQDISLAELPKGIYYIYLNWKNGDSTAQKLIKL